MISITISAMVSIKLMITLKQRHITLTAKNWCKQSSAEAFNFNKAVHIIYWLPSSPHQNFKTFEVFSKENRWFVRYSEEDKHKGFDPLLWISCLKLLSPLAPLISFSEDPHSYWSIFLLWFLLSWLEHKSFIQKEKKSWNLRLLLRSSLLRWEWERC